MSDLETMVIYVRPEILEWLENDAQRINADLIIAGDDIGITAADVAAALLEHAVIFAQRRRTAKQEPSAS